MPVLFKKIPGVYFVTIPLILGSFAVGLFFRGTDSLFILPHIAAMVLFGGITLWPNFQKGWAWPGGLFVTALIFYWIYVCISPLWSSVPYNSILFALIFSVLPFMFFVLVLHREPLQNLKLYIGALAAGMAVLSLWALVQFFVLDVGQRVHHPMLNPNNLAVVFNMAVFPALALYFCSQRRLYTVLGVGLALLYLAAMLTTQSRGGLLSFLLASIPFLIFVRGQAGFTVQRLFLFAVSALCVFLLVDFITSGRMGGGFASVLVVGDGEIDTVSERKLIWKATGQMIRDHFWLGTGLGSFTYFYPRYRLSGDFSDGYFAHMDPLQFWAEMGVVAPVLFYAVLVAVLLRTIRATRVSDTRSGARVWMYGFFCGLLALAGHAHISFHLYMPVILFMAAFLLAGWCVSSEVALQSQRKEIVFEIRSFNMVMRGVFILFLFLPLLWLSQAMAGIYYLNKANEFMQGGDLAQVRTALDKARFYAPKNYSRLYDYESRYRLYKLSEEFSSLSPEERMALYRESHEYIARAMDLNRGFVNLWNRKALIYFSGYPALDQQGLEKAEVLFKKTLAANPLLLEARFGLSRLYSRQGEDQKAIHVLEEGQSYPLPRSSATLDFYNKLARLKFKSGDIDAYNRLIQKRNGFADRYGVEITQPTPLSQEDIDDVLKHHKEL